MKKAKRIIIVVAAVVLICCLAVLSMVLYRKFNDDNWTGKINVGLFTDVTWDINEKMPSRLPVYSVEKGSDLDTVWSNILRYCDVSDDIIYQDDIYFSSDTWRVRVLDGEIICWNNNRRYESELIPKLSYEELENKSYAFLESLGIDSNKFYYTMCGIDPESESRTMNFAYDLGEYKADELPRVVSITFLGENIVDFNIKHEDVTYCGWVSPLLLSQVKERVKDIEFFSDNEELVKKLIVKDLHITGFSISYAQDDDKYVPFIRLMGEVRGYGAVTSEPIKAYDGSISTFSYADESEDVLNDVVDFFEYTMTGYEKRDLQQASSNFRYVIDMIGELKTEGKVEEDDPELVYWENMAYLHLALTDIQLEKYYYAAIQLEQCNDYFDQISGDENALISQNEIDKFRAYAKLGLAHIYTYYCLPEKAEIYLNEATTLMSDMPDDNMLNLFLAYEKTYLTPESADELVTLLEEWDENYTSKEWSEHEYYAPLMRIMAVKAYIKTDLEKAQKVIKYDLMSQEADLGTTTEEKMRILAETYTVYADYLEAADKEASIKEILSYRRTAASLYESLMLAHYNRVIIDGVYYKQTGEAYYKLAVLYAESGQTQAAIETVEYALEYLIESNVYAYVGLCDAYSLAVKLYTEVGDTENAELSKANLDFFKSEFPDFISETHPIDLRQLLNAFGN